MGDATAVVVRALPPPRPHLRLRLHDPDHERAAGYVAAWAKGLREQGLAGEIAFDTYRPETGRYGTGAAMAAADELFAADSAAALPSSPSSPSIERSSRRH